MFARYKGYKCFDLGIILVDMEELKKFSDEQGSPKADDFTHSDTPFWSERLCESKYEINEV